MTLEDMYELYELEKREQRSVPKYYFDADKERFAAFNEIVKKHHLTGKEYYYENDYDLYQKILALGYVPFIDSYETCMNIMKKYFMQKNDRNAAETLEKLPVDKNAIGERLHFLDRYCGGSSEFEDFELTEVMRVMRKWCKQYHIAF